jgi:AcrR family transcriptional regulator
MTPRHPRSPRQARSRATFDRQLAAAAELLAERRFEEAKVTDLVRRARSSVGAFYSLFGSKEALLQELDERLFEAGQASWTDFLADDGWKTASAGEILDAVIGRFVDKRRERRGLLRALALYARSRPDSEFARRSARLNRLLAKRLTEMLLEHRAEIGRARPGPAVAFALQIADSVTRDLIVFTESALAPGLPDAALKAELSRVLRLQLELKEG